MSPVPLSQILEGLRASGFRDLAGARVTATLPIGERLLNEVIAGSLPRNGMVRGVTVHPQPGDLIGVHVDLTGVPLVRSIDPTLVIERQPELPGAPQIVFRVTGLGLVGYLLPLVARALTFPPGVRLEGDLLTVDLAVMLAQQGQRELLRYAERLRVTSEAGRLIVQFDAAVPA